MKSIRLVSLIRQISCTLLLSVCTCSALSAADTLVIDQSLIKQDLLPFAKLFVDPSGELSIEDILERRAEFEEKFALSHDEPYPSTFWLQIPVKALTEYQGNLVVPGDSMYDYARHPLDYLDLYVVEENNEVRLRKSTGLLVPRSKKAAITPPFVQAIPFSLQRGEKVDLFLRFRQVRLQTELKLAVELRYIQAGIPQVDLSLRWIILGPWGMFIIIGFYVMVFYCFLRDRAFIYFGIFCLFYSFNLLLTEPAGGFFHFIPEHPHWSFVIFSTSLLSIFFLLLFGNAYIGVKKRFPAWYPYYQVATGLVLIVVIYYIVFSIWPPYFSFHTYLIMAVLALIPICIRFVFSNSWEARIFAIGIFSFIGGNVIGVLALMNGYAWGPAIWMAGQLILLFIYALALGYRLLDSQREKANAEKIRELDQLKTRFFTNISHEFRTPLSLILSPLQKAEESIPYSEMENAKNEVTIKTGHLSLMKRNALRLQQLIDQILDLAKIESGKMQLQLVNGDLVNFLQIRIAEFADLAAAKNIHFITTFPAENKAAVFDPDKLEKILFNLLSNAIKFTPANGKIEVAVAFEKKYLAITIQDTGTGMSPEEIHHLFDRFYQADNATQQGSGIGMALVKELIELHRGQINVQSTKGSGTTIRLKIGVDPALFPNQAHSKMPDLLAPRPVISKPETHHSDTGNDPSLNEEAPVVLVVEDNADLRNFLKELLQTDFYVITANDGEQGLQEAIENIPDLIVSDVMMPKVSGFQLCETLKKEEKTSHIPILLLTAKTERQDKMEGLNTGADDYLTKPFDEKELKVKVQNLIHLRAKLKEKYSQQPWKLVQNKITSLEEQFLQNVVSAIQKNLSNEYYSVEELGREVGFSRSQLFRKLKAITDKSPLDLIREHRLHYAKELLEGKAVSVSEAAYQVGYSNISYFSKSFKKEFGISPSEVGK